MNRTNQLTADFLAKRLPKEHFTHEAHLRVALWHLVRYSPPEALARLRAAIQTYNLANGGQNTETSGYHETITRFYVWLIGRFVNEMSLPGPTPSRDRQERGLDVDVDADLDLDALADVLVARFGDRKLPLQYYSEDVLMSVEARLGWVTPDLAPMEQPPDWS